MPTWSVNSRPNHPRSYQPSGQGRLSLQAQTVNSLRGLERSLCWPPICKNAGRASRSVFLAHQLRIPSPRSVLVRCHTRRVEICGRSENAQGICRVRVPPEPPLPLSGCYSSKGLFKHSPTFTISSEKINTDGVIGHVKTTTHAVAVMKGTSHVGAPRRDAESSTVLNKASLRGPSER